MKRNLPELADRRFDLLIIGGGITGACLAADATRRGLKVALVERGDFGHATSSASSKLLHGGIRYLQQGRIDKVRESALERARFQNLAPHLTRYIPFIVPAHRGVKRGRGPLAAAMLLYETICLGQNRKLRDGGKSVPRSRLLGRDEVRRIVPSASGVTGGLLLYESQMQSSERMTLCFLDSAARGGAVLANYVQVDEFLTEGGRVTGARATDRPSSDRIEIRAEVTLNAAGPWIPFLNRELGGRVKRELITGYSRGAHIVTRALTERSAIALPTRKPREGILTRGGRHIFIMPWRGHSLIGTSYAPHSLNFDDVRPTGEDVKSLIEEVNGALGETVLRESDVLYAFAGLYPLVDQQIRPMVYEGTGKYQIVDHARSDGIDGLVSVFGAKYTTARLLAEKALDLIAKRLPGPFRPCDTRTRPLEAGVIDDIREFRREKQTLYGGLLPPPTIDNLVTNYGRGIDEVLSYVKSDPALARPLTPGGEVVLAQLRHAVESEMAIHLDDFVFRRTGLGTLGDPGEDVLRLCSERMGDMLGWSQDRRDREAGRASAGLKSA